MNSVSLRFYVPESRRHGGRLVYEWLLERAKAEGVPGGSAYRAMAGYGRHGALHEDHFFELAGDLPVMVEFVLPTEAAERLLALVAEAGLNLPYVRQEAVFGVTGA